jgi:hypothetical protein
MRSVESLNERPQALVRQADEPQRNIDRCAVSITERGPRG